MSTNEKGSLKNNFHSLKENKDLFLACCDWESAIKAEREQEIVLKKKYEDFSDSSNENS